MQIIFQFSKKIVEWEKEHLLLILRYFYNKNYFRSYVTLDIIRYLNVKDVQ